MNFKELLKRYKEGKATEQEIEFIQEELEKYEALEEYITGEIDFDKELDPDRDFDFSPGEDKSLNHGTLNIQKSVNKRLRKVVLASVSIVVALYFIVFLVLSPLVDMFFYNPTKVSIGKNTQDFFYDLSAITRLNMPGTAISSAHASKTGFGKYDVYINRRDLFNENPQKLNLKIKRNMRNSFDFSHSDYYDIPFEISLFSESFIEDDNKRVISQIKQLNPISYISSYITFKEDLTMKELVALKEKYENENIELIWAAVRTQPKAIKKENSEINFPIISGFSLDFSTGNRSADDLPDKEKYPAFDYLGWLIKQDYHEDLPAEGYALHYKSLLQYVVDRKEASDTIEGTLKHDYYKESLDYAEENGVKTFGLLIYADAGDLAGFIENEDIESIQLNDVLPLRKNFGGY